MLILSHAMALFETEACRKFLAFHYMSCSTPVYNLQFSRFMYSSLIPCVCAVLNRTSLLTNEYCLHCTCPLFAIFNFVTSIYHKLALYFLSYSLLERHYPCIWSYVQYFMPANIFFLLGHLELLPLTHTFCMYLILKIEFPFTLSLGALEFSLFIA